MSVRPVRAGERDRFDAVLDEHHWLGSCLVGETMRYVASGPDGEWLAVLGFGAAALSCGPRERFIGWSDEQHFRRLRYVTNNQRFCVLPAGRRKNLASHVFEMGYAAGWAAHGRRPGPLQIITVGPLLVDKPTGDPSGAA